MPKNLHDTPATKEQVDAYNADPLDPKGKPYSTGQLESNARNIGRHFMYHQTEDARIFELGEEVPEGWQDTPFFNHNDNNKPIGEVKKEEKKEQEVPQTIDVKILRDECDKQKIEYDKRWGKQKLMEALENGNS